ncbi:MAG: LCP family protein [Nitrososphaerales archaeon]
MASILRHKWARWALPFLALVAGLLIGWMVLGWWLWPVQWTSESAGASLDPAEREKYLDVVAESYTLNRNAALAQERLAIFAPGEQPVLLQDVRTRVARRLEKTENILVLGDDTHHGYEIWRTDSIMVLAIDREKGQVGVISIPRDLYVDIPGYGQERINVVDYIGDKRNYPGGGPALAARVISDTLGIPTQHYVRVNLNGVIKLVDALGGVTVELDCPLYEKEAKQIEADGTVQWTLWSLPAGKVHLNGSDAKRFVTYRYVTSDFGRSSRQQQLIWALINRAREVNLLPRLPELWSSLAGLYSTDLSLVEVIKLAQFGLDLRPANVHSMQINMDVLKDYTTDDGAMVLVLDDRAALEQAKELLFMRKPIDELGKNKTGEACPPPPELP